MKTTTSTISNPINDSLLWCALILIPFVLMCVAALPGAQAVSPAPDGNYPGGNTAEGQNALLGLSTGTFNTAIGVFSLESLTEGNFNTGVGAGTLLVNTSDQNTATGAGALLNNTTGRNNTANGAFALFSDTIGNGNTAVGIQALFNNTTAAINTAIGNNALFSNTEGQENTAVGFASLDRNTTGDHNTAIGVAALLNNITGASNTAVGVGACQNVESANNVICIGANVVGADVSNTCFIGSIRGVTTQHADAIPVVIDSGGQLGTVSSSQRFKNQIKPMDKVSESLLGLKPVTFHYKGDNTSTPQFGLIAEEVAEVNPDLVVRDADGKIYTVRYEAVNAMLLNEFLKEHRKVERQERKLQEQDRSIQSQQATVEELKQEIRRLTETVKVEASEMQKVSARLRMIDPAVTRVAADRP
ncbi:MAG: tail fiber domain-containing protein [Candidatus Udaeobacter sp.]